MTIQRRHFITAWLALTVSATAMAQAQSYPNRPIRIVVPYAAGGPVDVVARVIGERLENYFQQRVLVDNRAGAGGNIASRYVAREPADGYTLLVNTSSMAVNQTLFRDPGYDLLSDMTAIGLVAASPNILVVPVSEPSNNLREFFARLPPASGQGGRDPRTASHHVAQPPLLPRPDE
jgi:tripartite-type tricarboxylate transporter receptor subunit TctC